jgi:hypothetical protein
VGFIFLATRTSVADDAGCDLPAAGSAGEAVLARLRAAASFTIRYPCNLPAGEELVSGDVTGEGSREAVIMVFEGPFELTLSQALSPPVVNPDPTGTTRRFENLYPDVRATLIERNDGTQDAFYDLLWERDGVYYEIVATGPTQTRRLILDIALSLE